MNSKNKVLLYGLIIGLLLYVIGALIYYYIFTDENTFLQVLFTAVPLSELYNRLLMFAGVMIFAFIVTGMISDLSLENEFLKHQQVTGASAKPDTSFISGLSYQIRTPLNAIVGFSELLKDPNLSMQSKLTYINHIHSSGNYLLQLVNNMVDITRIETGQLSINTEETPLNTLLGELFKYFDEQKKEMGKADVAIVLKKGIKDENLSILTDKERFKQVMTNLLENAFKMTEEGMVEFGYRVSDENILEFYVRDTGNGYSMERLEVIFNRYKKLSDNHNHPFDSAALLLTITKNLVKLLGGNIWADSKPGQGATFFFTLPFKEVQVKTTPEKTQSKTSAPGERDWTSKTVLIAEDVESNYIYLQELLRPSGVNLLWAKNGKEATEIV
ncbi:MAG TPA: hybrid sensor histidine kinase/response regulator, partial [Bacteroidales bacterium]|nr:hybrid sensor histidine kinase/response regulator [Bacteroidales bacterium]